ncbi:MAG: efflux RND transporter periplasmic adaptor subunit, partial [Chthoniobacteraceae bacterium]
MVSPANSADRAVPLLAKLSSFTGEPKDFWPLFLEATGLLTNAALASLHITVAGADGKAVWQRMLDWRAKDAGNAQHLGEPDAVMLQSALEHGTAQDGADAQFVAFRASAGQEGGTGIVCLAFADAVDRSHVWPVIRLLAETPAQYLAIRAAAAVSRRNEELLAALDLSLLVDRERDFLAAAMTVCNELAARFRCDRASLGWLRDDGIVRLRAISQAEKFEKKAQVVRLLELTMEECIDQDSEVAFPSPDRAAVTRDHAAYARETGAGNLLSVPLRSDGKVAAVFLCERQSAPFDEAEIRKLRIALDQIIRRLSDLEQKDHWFGARLWLGMRQKVAKLKEPRHTGTKIAIGLGALVILFLLLGRLPYRVGASFVLRSEQVAFVTSPFDGFVQDVAVRAGDNVQTGGVLARFDTRELVLQQAGALANVNRHQQEAEKARAANDLPEMRIAQAQAEQAKAALDQTKYHIEKAEIKAPFSAAVVEGDLRKRIGSPFRQGEVLFQLARLDTLYVELEVAERDVHEILAAGEAVIAFASAPEREF